MATDTARPYAPPPPPAAPEKRTNPALAGVAMLVVGAILAFSAVVGYGLADGRLKGWDRLSEGTSFGLPSSIVAIVSALLIVAGLVAIGMGIGSARRKRT